MSKYITLHPFYWLKEGFGTLMSHYAVMYSLHKDCGVVPIIADIDFKSKNQISAMEGFNNFNNNVIYHYEAFCNFKNIFSIVHENNLYKYNYILKNFTNLDYKKILEEIILENRNMACIWSLTPELSSRYLDDIINYLFIFNNDIISTSKNNLPNTNKDIVAVCVRNEYKKFNCPHTKLSLDFYIEAMKNYDINNSKYLIFSDDIEESKKMFNKLENIFNISYTQQMQSAIGMCTMSMCDHIICANSSFSYWASLLNKNINKKIVCSKYFIDQNKDIFLANLLNHKWYPKSWIDLDIV